MIVALVPAAGRSRRMGRAKLALPLGGEPIVARVVKALRDGGADRVLVVVPPPAEPDAEALARSAAGAGGHVLHLDVPTEDMRSTVEQGLASLSREGVRPSLLLLTPADQPGIDASLVARVIERAAANPGRIVVPFCRGKRGHPIALPWEAVGRISLLPPDRGINALIDEEAGRLCPVEVEDPRAFDDVDTPEDYERWRLHTETGGETRPRPEP